MADIDLATILADGEYLRRSGDDLIGDIPAAGGGASPFLNVTDFGAVGDGVTDDHDAIQDTFDAASSAGGGVVVFPGAHTYVSTGGLTYSTTAGHTNSLVVDAYGADIKLMSGSDTTLLTFARVGTGGSIPNIYVKGGRWTDASAGTGNTCFLWRDIGARMEDIQVRSFAAGKAIFLQNWTSWCEQSRIINCGSSACRHFIYFSDGADSGGPSGTTSFARTQVSNCSMSNGEAGHGLIRITGNVYHSSFIGLWGNTTGGEHIFTDDSTAGGMNGSRIHFSGFEGSTAGSYFYYRPTGTAPSFLPDIYGFEQIGANMDLSNLTDPAGNLTTMFVGRVRVAGWTSTLGTEWGLGLPGNKSIVSARHPSGSNPGGTRVTWAELNTSDELVIGSTNAGRAPTATSLGRQAPVKICAVGQPLGFFDTTPVTRPTGVTARAALEALGLGATLTADSATITDPELLAIAGLTSASNKLPFFTGSGTASVADFTVQAQTLVAQTTPGAMRSTLGLVIGTDVAPARRTINAQTGTTFTPTALNNENTMVTLSNAAAITVTMPSNATLAIPIGGEIEFLWLGVGQPTFVAGSGATVNGTPGLKLRAQYSAATAKKVATNDWVIIGDLAA